MARKTEDRIYVATRIEKSRVERIDTLRKETKPRLSRSQMLDLVIEKGVELVEREKSEVLQ